MKKLFKIQVNDEVRSAVDFAYERSKEESMNPSTFSPSWESTSCCYAPWELTLSADEMRDVLSILWSWGAPHKDNRYALFVIARQLTFL